MNGWPQFFVPTAEARAPEPLIESPPLFAIDLFNGPALTGPTLDSQAAPAADSKAGESGVCRPDEGAGAVEWAVTVDARTQLRLCSGTDRAALPAELHAQLNLHRLLGPVRTLAVRTLFLFDLEFMDLGANTPGLNDPLHLQGRLFGPFPSAQPCQVAGSLTVTRADLLDGLLRGAPFALQFARSSGGASEPGCCLHLLLPGASATELEAGNGAILAYPLLSSALSAAGPDNQKLAAGLLYDLLLGLQADFRNEQAQAAFGWLSLPVPNRRLYEAQLKARGYEIQGRAAFPPLAKPSRSWMGRLLGGLLREKLQLPPEGTLRDFLNLSGQVLGSMPAWPDQRARSLRALTIFPSLSWTAEHPALLRPVILERGDPRGQALVTREALVSPAKPIGRHLYFEVDEGFPFRKDCALEVELEYRGGPGECALVCHTAEEKPERPEFWTPAQPLTRAAEWRSLRFSIRHARLGRTLGPGSDLALFIKSRRRFELRRLTLRGRPGSPTLAALPLEKAGGPEGTVLKVESGAAGCLDALGRWPHGFMPETIPVPRVPDWEVRFQGWVLDLPLKTSAGTALLVLKGEGGEFAFATRGMNRPDLERGYAQVAHCAQGGLEGVLQPAQLPEGLYRAFLRLIRPDGRSCAEVDTGKRILIVAQAGGDPDRLSPREGAIELLSPSWVHWTGEHPGFDPCFKGSATSGSGELVYRVRVDPQRAYLVCLGLMEPEHDQAGQRVLELVVEGGSRGTLDLAASPGKLRPYLAVLPACDVDGDGWIEVKVARRRESTGPHANVFLYGIWLFPEGASVGEEAVMRGKWNDRALGYCPCGLAMQQATEALREALPRASLGVGREGLSLGWDGRQVASVGGQAGSIVAALFSGRRQLPPGYEFSAAAQPEQAGEFLERLRRAPANTILALGIRGALGRPFLKELRDVLRPFGLHAPLPGEGGCGMDREGVEQLFFLSAKGLHPPSAVELDGESAAFPEPQAERAGLLAQWRLDEGGGTRLNDGSGRGFHGELTGGRWIGQGETACLEFDGSGMVTVPPDPAFNLRGEMTISFWARPKKGTDRHMFLAGRGDPGRSYGFWWHQNDWSFWQVNRHGYQIMGIGQRATPLDTWVHLAGVVAGQEGIFYLNGREVGRCRRTGLPALTSCPFTIGGFNNTWHPSFRGQLRDVRVYNRALSAEEVRRCLEEGRPGPGVGGPRSGRKKRPKKG